MSPLRKQKFFLLRGSRSRSRMNSRSRKHVENCRATAGLLLTYCGNASRYLARDSFALECVMRTMHGLFFLFCLSLCLPARGEGPAETEVRKLEDRLAKACVFADAAAFE